MAARWNWLAIALGLAVAVPATNGCSKDEKSSSDDDDGGKKKKKKKKKKKDDDEDEDEDEDDKKAAKDGDSAPPLNDVPDEPPAVAPVPLPVVAPAPAPTPPPSAEQLLAGAVFKGIRQTRLEVPVPVGWKEFSKGLYSGIFSPDEKAVMAYTTIGSRGELAGRVQHIEKILGITNDRKTNETQVKLGPNQLDAFLHEADCNLHGKPGKLSYALVDQGIGVRTLVFLIAAAENDADPKYINQGTASFLNIRRR